MKGTLIATLIAGALIVGAVWLSADSKTAPSDQAGGNNVAVVDGVQVIDIIAKGGYSPRLTMAKAGMPTVLKMNTRGTFDCSSALVIPAVNYREFLPPSGVTEITIPPQEAGSKIEGLCSMGMYSFVLNFN